MDDNLNVIAVFYCQNTPGADKDAIQDLEQRYGNRLRLYPIPCGGRLEPVHLLKALEAFADSAYLIACPDGACKYFEGNIRAIKRVSKTQKLIQSIGLESERVGMVIRGADDNKNLSQFVEDLLKKASDLAPSRVFKFRGREW